MNAAAIGIDARPLPAELGAPRRVPSLMGSSTAPGASFAATRTSPWHVRRSLLVALGVSLLLHALWSLWPVEFSAAPEETTLTATLEAMPPPPVPVAQPAPAPQAARTLPAQARPRPRRHRSETPPPLTAPHDAVAVDEPSVPGDAMPAAAAPVAARAAPMPSAPAAAAPAAPVAPAVVLPPRLDLAYKVFFGTQGFVIGEATYRFEHSGDAYRISTVGQARGLAALIVRGRGKVESRGRITATGLEPYEFAIERGSAERREVAYFDWDAGNVVLHDGTTAQLAAPAFDPLTILWQPYFSPPGRDDQTFSLATTRKVARYTLSLQGEETIAWPHGEVLTQRWHRMSDDGKTEAWFWLAPSMHYIPIKMRVTRTARGTLEVLLDAIRTDDAGDADGDAAPPAEANAQPQAWNPRVPMPGPDATGQ